VFKLLSDKGFGPHYYGLFENGRIEGWFFARAITPQEMAQREPKDFPVMISSALARMHSLDMPFDRSPMIWRTLESWLAMAGDLSFDDAHKQAALLALDLPAVHADLSELQKLLPSPLNRHGEELIAAELACLRLAGASDAALAAVDAAMHLVTEVVFCHNDLLSGNILDVEEEKRTQIIDFEYGGYNYAGFDFANHFCEHAGFDFDLDRWYPDRSAQVSSGGVCFHTHFFKLCKAVDVDAPSAIFSSITFWREPHSRRRMTSSRKRPPSWAMKTRQWMWWMPSTTACMRSRTSLQRLQTCSGVCGR
jgi:ethanolamine kinase